MPRIKINGKDFDGCFKFEYEKIFNEKHINKNTVGANAYRYLICFIKNSTILNEREYENFKSARFKFIHRKRGLINGY